MAQCDKHDVTAPQLRGMSDPPSFVIRTDPEPPLPDDRCSPSPLPACDVSARLVSVRTPARSRTRPPNLPLPHPIKQENQSTFSGHVHSRGVRQPLTNQRTQRHTDLYHKQPDLGTEVHTADGEVEVPIFMQPNSQSWGHVSQPTSAVTTGKNTRIETTQS